MFSKSARTVAVAWVCLAGSMSIAQQDNSAPTFKPYVGEVNGENVYVRSGPSTNFYIVTKAKAGDRLVVVAEEKGWLGIVPPEGCFSLIAVDYVDRDRDPSVGIVTGDRVNVRAAGPTTEMPYAVQTQLNRGAEVQLLGKHNDRFLRIQPPEGAVLWITDKYVVRVPNAPVPAVTVPKIRRPARTAGRTTMQPAVNPDDITSSVPPIRIQAPPIKPGEYEKTIRADRAELDRIEAGLTNEMEKPLFDRNLQPLVDRFRALHKKTQDDYTRYYAQARIAQLENLSVTIIAVQEAYEIQSGVATERDRYASEREKIKTVRIPEEESLVAQGELRESAVYTSRVGPRRYRLIDPEADVTRTICYIEVPMDSDIDVSQYLGRLVGVHSRTKHLRTDSIDPVPIVVADRLVLLDELVEPAPDLSADFDDTETADTDPDDTDPEMDEPEPDPEPEVPTLG